MTEDPISVPQQIAWRAGPRECLSQLLSGPLCRRMGRDGEADNASPLMRQHPYIEDLERMFSVLRRRGKTSPAQIFSLEFGSHPLHNTSVASLAQLAVLDQH